MNKFLKSLVIALLAVLVGVTTIACSKEETVNKGKTGLLYKKIDGVYTIYEYVDEGKGITELNIADYLEDGITDVRIQAEAFNGNDTLKSIIVPSTVTEIDKGAFAGMKALEEITLPYIGRTAHADVTVNGTSYNPEEDDIDKSVNSERTIAHLFGTAEYNEGVPMTINYGGTDSDKTSTCYVPVTLKKITIKPEGEYNIPMCAFNGFNMPIEIVLDGTVKAIGDYAFAGATKLTKITLPTTVEKINNGAFAGATNLKDINLIDLANLTEIGENAFENTALKEVVIPEKVTKIGSYAFKDSKLTKITLSKELKTLGNYAFYNCVKLQEVYTDGVTGLTIGVYAFGDCEMLSYFGALNNKAENTIYVNGFTVNANAFDTGIEYAKK